MTLTGLPAAIQPANTLISTNFYAINQNVGLWAGANVGGSTVIFGDAATPDVNGYPNQAGFNSTGVKGLPAGWSMIYPLS